jgi:hypothetical protein
LITKKYVGICDVELHFAIFLANYDNNDSTQKNPCLLIVVSIGLKQLAIKGFGSIEMCEMGANARSCIYELINKE